MNCSNAQSTTLELERLWLHSGTSGSEYLKRVLVAKWRRLQPLAQSKWKLRLQKDRITGEELTRLLDSIKPIKTRGAVTLALGQPLWRGARKMLM